VSDAGEYCDIASSCLCGGAFVHAGNLPADGVLEATVTASYVAQVTATFGATTGFAVGDVICVDQSTVGATILVPLQSGTDAAQVVPPPPDGGTCVPNFAYTVQLDDAGRPLACNDGTESTLALTEQQAVAAMRASDCNASLASIDSHWADDECATSAGCNTSGASALGHVFGGAAMIIAFAFWVRCRGFTSSERTRPRRPPSSR
jgi:hypothetical protein